MKKRIIDAVLIAAIALIEPESFAGCNSPNGTTIEVQFPQAPEPTSDPWAIANNYGYDDMDTPQGNDDHVSIIPDNDTYLNVTIDLNGDGIEDTIGSTEWSEYSFASDDPSIAHVSISAAASTHQDAFFCVQGHSSGSTTIKATRNNSTGTCGEIKVHVYDAIDMQSDYVRVVSQGITSDDVMNSANTILKHGCANLDLADKGVIADYVDHNGNNRLDLYMDGDNPEFGPLLLDAWGKQTNPDIVVCLAGNLFFRWHVQQQIAPGDNTITKQSNYKTGVIYCISNGSGSNLEKFKIIGSSTLSYTVEVLSSPTSLFQNNHAVTDDIYIENDTGLAGGVFADPSFPIFISGASVQQVGRIATHEFLHKNKSLSDINDPTNIMHYEDTWNSSLAKPIRYKKVFPVQTTTGAPLPGNPTENQWETK